MKHYAGLGLLIGLVSALAVMRLLSAFLFGVSSSDTTTLALSAAILAIVAALACYIPGRHAMRVDPLIAIRAE